MRLVADTACRWARSVWSLPGGGPGRRTYTHIYTYIHVHAHTHTHTDIHAAGALPFPFAAAASKPVAPHIPVARAVTILPVHLWSSAKCCPSHACPDPSFSGAQPPAACPFGFVWLAPSPSPRSRVWSAPSTAHPYDLRRRHCCAREPWSRRSPRSMRLILVGSSLSSRTNTAIRRRRPPARRRAPAQPLYPAACKTNGDMSDARTLS